MARVCEGEDKSGYIDFSGKIVLEEGIGDFDERGLVVGTSERELNKDGTAYIQVVKSWINAQGKKVKNE